MKRRLVFGLLGIALVVNLVIGERIYVQSAHAGPEKDSPYASLKLFSTVLEMVRKDYVDGKSLTYQDLVYGALKGMINTLDPHSEFMEPSKFDELQKDTEGVFGGLGVIIEMKDNFVTVVAPMEDSPGAKAGMLAGDRIIRINGKNASRMQTDEAAQLLRGEPGSQVSLSVLRPSNGQVLELTLTRAIIKVDTVKDINEGKEFPVGPDKIGYVRLTQFGEKTSDDLEKAIKKMKAQGMQAMIMDLRWNPGGLLDQAVGVCEKFLPRGQLIVSTEGQNPTQNSRHVSHGSGDELNGMPMVVLVNVSSASAAEIVSGCLQDLHRAQIMGEKSFGKGSVQTIIPVGDDGAALRLTTAKYYTPAHKVIHGVGITPDCPVPMTDEEEAALLLHHNRPSPESWLPGEKDMVANIRDPQYDRAVDLLKGILIYTHRSVPGEKVAAAGKVTASNAK